MMLSVVIPVYNEEEVLETSHQKLTEEMEKYGLPYELLFVNDGSRDRSGEILQQLAQKDPHTKAIHFSRNFGHEIATTAGLDYAAGNAIVIIDADLQDPPEVIHKMIELWRQGYDVVYGRRKKREGESFFKKISAALFYRLLNCLSEIPIPADVGDFRLLDKKVRDALLAVRERNRFVRGLFSWVGFKQTYVDFVRDPRKAGATKYNPITLIKLAVNAIISFSSKPLRIATYMGILTSVCGFIYTFDVVYEKLFTDNTVQGWSSLMCVFLIFNGVILLMLGIMGEYIGRIFSEAKKRPLYIIESFDGVFPSSPQLQNQLQIVHTEIFRKENSL